MSLMVEIKSDADRSAFVQELDATGLFYRDFKSFPTLFSVEFVTKKDFVLRKHPAIKKLTDDDWDAVKPNETVNITALPFTGPWGLLRHINRDRPWNFPLKLPVSGEFNCVRDGRGVDIYIMDSGLRVTHTEFGSRASRLDTWTPIFYHGTFCAGLAGGATTGFARAAEIFGAAGLRNGDGSGSNADITAALDAILIHYNSRRNTNRPAVLNLSFESTTNSYDTAIQTMVSAGIVCVAAAGNGGVNLGSNDIFPAETANVLCAGAINMDDGPMNTGGGATNFGTQIDLLAAGQRVKAPTITSDTSQGTADGTSFAAPYIVGMIACVLQDYGRLTSASQVRAVIEYMYQTATFGRYQKDVRFLPMTDAIAYLDPGAGPYPAVPSLVPYQSLPNTIKAASSSVYTVLGPSPNSINVGRSLVYTIITP